MYALFSKRNRRWRKQNGRLARKVAVLAALDSRERLRSIDPQVLIDRCVYSREQIRLADCKGKGYINFSLAIWACSWW
jgi:hypothetical protein